MKFPTPLIKATLIKRYKRFLADVELNSGEMITVHCPNPGAMLGVKQSGSSVWISDSNNPKRKLRYTLELIELQDANRTMVGVNTNMPNKIAEETILSRCFDIFGQFDELRREVKYGENSRIDILLSANGRPDTYIEVKSITMQRQPGLHEFPDGVTERGRKHLVELAKMVQSGHRAIMLYLIQRNDGDKFSLARDVDPQYAAAFDEAVTHGVEAIAIRCKVSSQEIVAEKTVEIDEAILSKKS